MMLALTQHKNQKCTIVNTNEILHIDQEEYSTTIYFIQRGDYMEAIEVNETVSEIIELIGKS